MKAAVFTGPYEFKICDREKPKPGPKEVLIRIRAVGICGSDIHHIWGWIRSKRTGNHYGA